MLLILIPDVRCLVQNVNSVLNGRPTSSLPCEAREPPQKQQQQNHDGPNNAASVPRRFLPPSLLCAGLVTFAGAQLSRLAFEWWREDGGGVRTSRPSLVTALPMRDSKLATKSRGAQGAADEDRVALALGASLEEACDLVNQEGAAFARRGEWSKALECFQSAAVEGHAPAQFNLGLYFHTVSVDLERAQALYQQAAASGHPEATYNLSTILLSQEKEEWETHMQSAAGLGLVNAQTFLGSFYFEKGDLAKARRYFGMGLANKEATEVCSYWLGRCYEAEGALPIADLWYAQVRRSGGVLAEECRQRLQRTKLRPTHSAVAFDMMREERQEMEEGWSLGGARFFVPEEEAGWRGEEEEKEEERSQQLRLRERAPLRKSQSVSRCLG